MAEHCCETKKAGVWWRNKTLIVAALLILIKALSGVVPAFEPFSESLMMYLKKIWWAVLLGLLVGESVGKPSFNVDPSGILWVKGTFFHIRSNCYSACDRICVSVS